MYVVDSATVSIHVVCLCLVLSMIRLVGFVFATAKTRNKVLFIRRTDEMEDGWA